MAGDPADAGFVRLSRRFFKHFLWTERRSYSKAEAWLDIVALCAYEPQKRLIAGELVEIPRGGFVASERYLSDRWMWSRTKVRAFLDLLLSENMLVQPQKDHQETMLLLSNEDGSEPQKVQQLDQRKNASSLNGENKSIPRKNHRPAAFLLCNYDKYNQQKDRRTDQRRTSEEPPKDQIEEPKDGKTIFIHPPRRGWSLEEVTAAGNLASISPEVCKLYHDSRMAVEWVDRNGNPIKSMPHDLAKFAAHYKSNDAEKSQNGRKPRFDAAPRPEGVWQLKERKDAIQGEIRRLQADEANHDRNPDTPWEKSLKPEVADKVRKLKEALSQINAQIRAA
jgi:hypothetical protein